MEYNNIKDINLNKDKIILTILRNDLKTIENIISIVDDTYLDMYLCNDKDVETLYQLLNKIKNEIFQDLNLKEIVHVNQSQGN